MNLSEIQNKIDTNRLTVAYFSFPECNVCKVLRPKVEHLVQDQFKTAGFVYINTEEHPSLSGQHLVFAAPTVIVFSEGKETQRFSRHFSMNDLESHLSRISEMLDA